MKRSLPFLLLMLCASAVVAQAPGASSTPLSNETKKAVSALVQDQLVKPLHRVQSKRSRFSRVGPMSVERRVRVLDAAVYTDARGKTFVRFAIDTRDTRSDDGSWENNAMSGCAYPNERKVFVQSGDEFLLPSSVFGGDQDPQADVCRAAPVAAAQIAAAPQQ